MLLHWLRSRGERIVGIGGTTWLDECQCGLLIYEFPIFFASTFSFHFSWIERQPIFVLFGRLLYPNACLLKNYLYPSMNESYFGITHWQQFQHLKCS